MKFSASVAVFGLAAFAVAQNSTASATSSAVGCVASLNACQSSGDPNEATCSADNAACQGACETTYNSCRSTGDPNEATCAGEYATCLGSNPFASSATSSSSAAASTATGVTSTGNATYTDCVKALDSCQSSGDPNEATCAAENAACQGDCYSSYNTCRSGPDANFATCAGQYSSCLGEDPFASNGTNTVTPSVAAAAQATSATTEVVSVFTTYCPEATTLTYGSMTYTVSSATTLTITDCPCTITKATAVQATATGSSGNGTATSSIVAYTGAADKVAVGGVAGLLAMAALAL